MDLFENRDSPHANANATPEHDASGTKTTPSPLTPKSASRTPLEVLSPNKVSSKESSPWQEVSRQVSFSTEGPVVHQLSPEVEPNSESTIDLQIQYPPRAPIYPDIPETATYSIDKDSDPASSIASARAHFQRLADVPNARAPTPESSKCRFSQRRNACNVTRRPVGKPSPSTAENSEPVQVNLEKKDSEGNQEQQYTKDENPLHVESGESAAKLALANHIRKSSGVRAELRKMKELSGRIPNSSVNNAKKAAISRAAVRLPKTAGLNELPMCSLEDMPTREFVRRLNGSTTSSSIDVSGDETSSIAKEDEKTVQDSNQSPTETSSDVAQMATQDDDKHKQGDESSPTRRAKLVQAPVTIHISRAPKDAAAPSPAPNTMAIPKSMLPKPKNDGLSDDEESSGNLMPRSKSDMPRHRYSVAFQDREDYVVTGFNNRIGRTSRGEYGYIAPHRVVQVDAGGDGNEIMLAPRCRSDLDFSQPGPSRRRRARSSFGGHPLPIPVPVSPPPTDDLKPNGESTSQVTEDSLSANTGTDKSSNQPSESAQASNRVENGSAAATVEMLEKSARSLSGFLAAHTIQEARRNSLGGDGRLNRQADPRRSKSFVVPGSINKVMRDGFNNAHRRLSRSGSIPRTMSEMAEMARDIDDDTDLENEGEDLNFWYRFNIELQNEYESEINVRAPSRILVKCHWKRKWVLKPAAIRDGRLRVQLSRTRSFTPKRIKLSHVRSVEPCHAKDNHQRCYFAIFTYKRNYMYAAQSPDERDAWVNALRTEIRALQERSFGNVY